jgi:miniconductance mechanosensitive channel
VTELLYQLTGTLEAFGLPMAAILARTAIVAVVVFLSLVVNWLAKQLLLRGLSRFIGKTSTTWDDLFLRAGVFSRLSHLAPALVIYAAADVIFPEETMVRYSMFVTRVSAAYMVVVGCLVIDAFLTALVHVYRTFEVSRQRPIKSFVQVAKIFVYLVTIILVIAILTDKNPWAFLTGLGALTAVILLVFKDSILGLVAGIQLTSNDMLRIGDWIEMPKYGADGDVIDITLHTVKVQNWDKTISTIPAYSLIADSFKNWRGMNESGGRRIKRSICLDMNSVKFVDAEMAERFRKFALIHDYIDRREKEITEHNVSRAVDTSVLVNGRRMTNLGTFRHYVEAYLRDHPKIHEKNMTLLVRQLKPSETGIPIEIYCFSNDQRWASYEAIQADIVDHILAVIPEFDLRVFQRPSGVDLRDAFTTVSGKTDGA